MIELECNVGDIVPFREAGSPIVKGASLTLVLVGEPKHGRTLQDVLAASGKRVRVLIDDAEDELRRAQFNRIQIEAASLTMKQIQALLDSPSVAPAATISSEEVLSKDYVKSLQASTSAEERQRLMYGEWPVGCGEPSPEDRARLEADMQRHMAKGYTEGREPRITMGMPPATIPPADEPNPIVTATDDLAYRFKNVVGSPVATWKPATWPVAPMPPEFYGDPEPAQVESSPAEEPKPIKFREFL